MKNWIVVANASRARILEEGDRPGTYVHRADLVHPASRQKGVDLGDDRPGHVEGIGHGPGGAAYQPRTNPRVREHDRFARQIATLLDEGAAGGRCAGIVLVASNPFLGLLEARLGAQTRQLLLRCLPRDFTTVAEGELARRIGQALARPRARSGATS